MNLKPLDLSAERPDILRAKHTYGIWYGAMLGLSFAIFAWGIDGYILSQHHGLQPWLKFILGAVLFALPGGITGWLSAKVSKPLFSILLWLVAAAVFAWLIVNLPIAILPKVLGMIEPQTKGLLHYAYAEALRSRVGVAYSWLVIFVAIGGLLQIPLSDSAVFSTSYFGRIAPFLLLFVLMGINGAIVDNGVINEPFRSATAAVDDTIQFILDNRGKVVDKALSRQMHVGAFRAIDESVTQGRELIVNGYDGTLGQISILVKFERDWVECQVFYNQLSTCKVLEVSP